MERAINKTARVILEIDEQLIFIKRIKRKEDGSLFEYYTTVGGHLEEGETFEKAAIREAKEELGINIKLESMFMEGYNEKLNVEEKYYNVSYISGKLGTGLGEEFDGRRENFKKYGSYDIVSINKNQLDSYNILPEKLKEKLIAKYK